MLLHLRRTALLIATVLALASPLHADVRASTRTPKAPTAISVIVDYQRVGHELLALEDQRGKFDCGDLMPRFRAIKLEQALATPAARIATAATLAEIATTVERLRGIRVEAVCLHNPLAAGCS